MWSGRASCLVCQVRCGQHALHRPREAYWSPSQGIDRFLSPPNAVVKLGNSCTSRSGARALPLVPTAVVDDPVVERDEVDEPATGLAGALADLVGGAEF